MARCGPLTPAGQALGSEILARRTFGRQSRVRQDFSCQASGADATQASYPPSR